MSWRITRRTAAEDLGLKATRCGSLCGDWYPQPQGWLRTVQRELGTDSQELRAANEKLQAINDELRTVNSELKIKLEAISRAHGDLQNLVAMADFGTLFLDFGLRIKLVHGPGHRSVQYYPDRCRAADHRFRPSARR